MRHNRFPIMERRDSGGAEKPSEVPGACSRERRARQDSRRGLFALRSVEGKEIAARRRHQLPARKEVRKQPPRRHQPSGRGATWWVTSGCCSRSEAPRLHSRHQRLTKRCSEPRASLRSTFRVFAIHALVASHAFSGSRSLIFCLVRPTEE